MNTITPPLSEHEQEILQRIRDHRSIFFAPSSVEYPALNVDVSKHLFRQLSHVRIACHRDKLKQRVDEPDRRSNPWKMYFVFRDARTTGPNDSGESVTVEMLKDDPVARSGIVAVRYRPYDVSALAFHTLRLQVSPEQTKPNVAEALIHLINANLVQYQFGIDHEEGCRHWTRVVVKHLEAVGWLASGSLDALDEVIHFVYTENAAGTVVPTPDEIKRGKFIALSGGHPANSNPTTE